MTLRCVLPVSDADVLSAIYTDDYGVYDGHPADDEPDGD